MYIQVQYWPISYNVCETTYIIWVQIRCSKEIDLRMSAVNIIGWKMDLHIIHKEIQNKKTKKQKINLLFFIYLFICVQSYKLVLVVTRKRREESWYNWWREKKTKNLQHWSHSISWRNRSAKKIERKKTYFCWSMYTLILNENYLLNV